MVQASAVVVVVVLGALAVLQVLVALGAPLGRFVWGGAHDVLPARLRAGSAVSVLLYAGMATVVLDRAGLIAVLPDGFTRVATWVLVAYFAVGVVLNAISRSRAEALTMTPTCLVLALGTLAVATG
jgi:hypothetical protein